jgi:hypothetical protein
LSGHPQSDIHVIQLHVAELRQMYNSMDPAPFHSRDLDPKADTFIIEWARDLPRKAPLALRVHVDAPQAAPEDDQALTASIRRYFGNRALSARRRLRNLFARGRSSLLIGVAFLSSALLASEMLGQLAGSGRFLILLRESLMIGGWVAMWRPLEIFLYDWWPMRAEIRLLERLRDMQVGIQHGTSDASQRPIAIR